MTSRLHLLLAATCALALIQLASGEECSRINKWGQQTDREVKYEPIFLKPGVKDWKIKIPNENCVEVGGSTYACDYDKAPEASFLEARQVFVHRPGDAKGYGRVEISLYC
ncbi:uncharacterized protein LOC142985302 [Anticarsia gemmatalis]|uniref:uncharacterized protein LOC142985302 n=1 Tax=Anticarsia gemmatalis TaxID=129554 RepID=UPI003F76FE6D